MKKFIYCVILFVMTVSMSFASDFSFRVEGVTPLEGRSNYGIQVGLDHQAFVFDDNHSLVFGAEYRFDSSETADVQAQYFYSNALWDFGFGAGLYVIGANQPDTARGEFGIPVSVHYNLTDNSFLTLDYDYLPNSNKDSTLGGGIGVRF